MSVHGLQAEPLLKISPCIQKSRQNSKTIEKKYKLFLLTDHSSNESWWHYISGLIAIKVLILCGLWEYIWSQHTAGRLWPSHFCFLSFAAIPPLAMWLGKTITLSQISYSLSCLEVLILKPFRRCWENGELQNTLTLLNPCLGAV